MSRCTRCGTVAECQQWDVLIFLCIPCLRQVVLEWGIRRREFGELGGVTRLNSGVDTGVFAPRRRRPSLCSLPILGVIVILLLSTPVFADACTFFPGRTSCLQDHFEPVIMSAARTRHGQRIAQTTRRTAPPTIDAGEMQPSAAMTGTGRSIGSGSNARWSAPSAAPTMPFVPSVLNREGWFQRTQSITSFHTEEIGNSFAGIRTTKDSVRNAITERVSQKGCIARVEWRCASAVVGYRRSLATPRAVSRPTDLLKLHPRFDPRAHVERISFQFHGGRNA